MQFFRHKTKQLRLVYFSLFAVLMLTFGPFTSQLLAAIATAQITTNTQQQDAHHGHTEHQATKTTIAVATADPTTKMPSHHNMNLCGYCDLLHTPIISAHIAIAIQLFSVHQDIIHYHTYIPFLSPYNYPLSQAPPQFFPS